MIKGIAASSGIAIAKAYKLTMPDLSVTKKTINGITVTIANITLNVNQVTNQATFTIEFNNCIKTPGGDGSTIIQEYILLLKPTPDLLAGKDVEDNTFTIANKDLIEEERHEKEARAQEAKGARGKDKDKTPREETPVTRMPVEDEISLEGILSK